MLTAAVHGHAHSSTYWANGQMLPHSSLPPLPPSFSFLFLLLLHFGLNLKTFQCTLRFVLYCVCVCEQLVPSLLGPPSFRSSSSSLLLLLFLEHNNINLVTSCPFNWNLIATSSGSQRASEWVSDGPWRVCPFWLSLHNSWWNVLHYIIRTPVSMCKPSKARVHRPGTVDHEL